MELPALRCWFRLSLRYVPRKLIAQENESAGHQGGIRRKSMLEKSAMHPPITQANEHSRQREHLANLYSHVEAEDVCHQAGLGERQFLKLRCQAKAVEQTENEHGYFRIRLKPQEALEAADIVKSLVHHRERDHRIDQVWIRAHMPKNSQQKCGAMPQSEETHV